MRLICSFVGMLMLGVAMDACFNAPEFPTSPEISFKDIVFRDVSDPSQADTLIVTINFKDGDGDLGLDPSEVNSPYNDKFYYFFSNGQPLNYKAKRTIAAFDTLPDFVAPFNCTNWEVERDDSGGVIDTVYVTLNPNHNNFFVEFYVNQNINGKDSLVRYDWSQFLYPLCQVDPFNGRFPVLAKDVNQTSAQEGTIRYAMPSVAFNILFSIKVLQMKIWIEDRALHKSNVITTEKFTLPGIRK